MKSHLGSILPMITSKLTIPLKKPSAYVENGRLRWRELHLSRLKMKKGRNKKDGIDNLTDYRCKSFD